MTTRFEQAMELTNHETNVATILGGTKALEKALKKAEKESWSERAWHKHLTDNGVAISSFGARSLLLKGRRVLTTTTT